MLLRSDVCEEAFFKFIFEFQLEFLKQIHKQLYNNYRHYYIYFTVITILSNMLWQYIRKSYLFITWIPICWRRILALMYSFRQKYLTIWQHSCEWNCRFGEFVFERPSSGTQTFQVQWSAGLKSIGLSLWWLIWKTTILPFYLSGYFVDTSILIGKTVPLVAILYCCGWET